MRLNDSIGDCGIRSANEGVIHSNDLLSQFLALTQDGIILTDNKMRIVLFNDGSEKIFGWKSEEVLGRELAVIVSIRNGEMAQPVMTPTTVDGRHRDGDPLALEVTVTKLRGEFSPMYGLIVRDISKREIAVAEQQRRLNHIIEMKSMMLNIVAHDLRTPLTSINLNCDVLMEREQLSGDGYELLTNIRHLSSQITSELTQLLVASSQQGGNGMRVLENFNLRDLVLEVVGEQTASVVRKNQQLRVNMETYVPVRAERQSVRHAIANYLSNAIKYTPTGKGIEIHLQLRGDDECVLQVIDEGPGLQDEDLEKLFKRFHTLTAKPTGGETSHGLGLFIVKYLIEAQAGTVRGMNRPDGCGAIFEFTLPTQPGKEKAV